MRSQILVPLDGSPLAEAIVPTAQVYAHLTGASILLLAVIEAAVPPDADTPARLQLRREVEAATARALAYLATIDDRLVEAGISARRHVAHGPVAEEIIRASAGCSMIIMSTHGRSGLSRWARGSVADKVVRGAQIPVLLVRPTDGASAPARTPRSILAPLDGSELAEQALPLAAQLARAAGARLLLLHAFTWPVDLGASLAYLTPIHGADLLERDEARMREYLAHLAQPLAASGLTVATELRSDRPAEAILNAAATQPCDLIVMSTHGRGGLGRWMLGSIAERVLHGATTPVMLVRAAASGQGEAMAGDAPDAETT